MTGAITATQVIAAASVAAAGYGVYAGERASKQQKQALQSQESAQATALTEQKKQAATSEQNINKANQKSPDASAILAQAQTNDAYGGMGTMLTGPKGVDPNALSLGKNTLLGG
jgi:hypothetical protein